MFISKKMCQENPIPFKIFYMMTMRIIMAASIHSQVSLTEEVLKIIYIQGIILLKINKIMTLPCYNKMKEIQTVKIYCKKVIMRKIQIIIKICQTLLLQVLILDNKNISNI